MDTSNVVNFSALKSTEQIDALIAELEDYKNLLVHKAMAENWREEVDRKLNEFLSACEKGYSGVYMFIPLEAMSIHGRSELNGEKGYYFNLETGLMTETIADNDGDIVCRVSENA